MVCVRQGDLFPPQYVEMLRKMVFLHTGVGLVTLTDREDTPGVTVPLKAGFRGWWAKLELFAPWNRHLRPCLYFDLDTYILGDCRDLLEEAGFMMLRDFFHEKKAASGVMTIPKEVDEIWDSYNGERPGSGDQEYLGRFKHGILQEHYEGITSYKVDVLGCRPNPKGPGRIVCFHGKPKPHEADGWAGAVWRAYTRGD